MADGFWLGVLLGALLGFGGTMAVMVQAEPSHDCYRWSPSYP